MSPLFRFRCWWFNRRQARREQALDYRTGWHHIPN